MSLQTALSSVSASRAAGLTLDLVSIPSPTGDTVEVSDRFAAELRSLGMAVEVYLEHPRTPVVIGRLAGKGGGPTLILNGHLDTVPIPHAAPERRDGRVYGRGSADMKGCLAAAVEAVRAAGEAGLRFRGDLILCAHGLHEAPGGHGEDLTAALRAGVIRGDAAIVLELANDNLPLAGLGMGIFHARFSRPAAVTHELKTPEGTPNPAYAAAQAAVVLRRHAGELARNLVEHVGPESLFLGQIHCGDFYNRFPNEAWIEGTRRYAPEATAAQVHDQLLALLEPVAAQNAVRLDFTFEKVRDGFRIGADHPLVGCLRAAYTAETGAELPLGGSRVVADAPLFEKEGGIPCLYHGLAGEGAHGDVESLAESELARAARVYLRTAAAYIGLAGA